MLRMFYDSVVARLIFYAVGCWGGSMKVVEAKKLNKLIRKAGSEVAGQLGSLETVTESSQTLSRLWAIMENTDHPLHSVVAKLKSTFSLRLTRVKCSTQRHRRSFLPTVARLYNSSLRHSSSQ